MQTHKPRTMSAWMCIGVSLLLLLAPVHAAAEAGGAGSATSTSAPASAGGGAGGGGAVASSSGGTGSGVPASPASSGGTGVGGGSGGFAPPSSGGTGVGGGGFASSSSGGQGQGMMGQGMAGGGAGGFPGQFPPAPPVVEQRNVRPQFQTLGLTGMGIALSGSDPSDYHIVRVGIATVHVMVFDEAQEVTVGMLIFDDARYSLKEVTLGADKVSAAVFEKSKKVGALSLASSRRGGFEVWAGETTLNGVRLSTYILQPPRPPTPDEYGADARRYCESNPSGCKGIAPTACDPAQPGCGAEIERYCATNTNDTRCFALQRGQCAQNPQDVRCRNTEVPPGIAANLSAFCQQKPDLCNGLGSAREEILRTCVERPSERCYALMQNYCAAYPGDPGCQGKPEGPPFGPPTRPGGQPGSPGSQGFGAPGQGFGAFRATGQGFGLENRTNRTP